MEVSILWMGFLAVRALTTFRRAIMQRGNLFSLLLLTLGCAQSAPAPVAEDATPAINALRDSIQAAEVAGNADGMLALLADDVVNMPPDAPAVIGKPAVSDMFRTFLQSTSIAVQYDSQEVVVSGDWAFDRRTYSGTMTPKAGGAAVSETGKYLWVLHKDAAGSWKFARIIWNTDTAPPTM